MRAAGEFGIVRSYPSGTQLYGQDEIVADVYLIKSGVLKLTWANADGAETIVGLRWPGSFLGASSLIASSPSPTAAVTLVPTVVEQLPAESFSTLLHTNHELAARLHQAHSREILEQMAALGELACVPARDRLKSLLLRLARSVSDQVCLPDGRMRLPLKKKELAALVSITPEHLSRTLDEMASAGDLRISGQWIILPDVRPRI